MRNDTAAKSALESSLAKLGLGYIDLWLMHWPIAFKNDPPNIMGGALAPEESPNYVEVWKEMESLYETDGMPSEFFQILRDNGIYHRQGEIDRGFQF